MGGEVRSVVMSSLPPEKVDLPPQFETTAITQKKWNWLTWAGIILVLIVVLVLSAPMVLRSQRMADSTQTVCNARQIGLALFEFKTEYGCFPDETTIAQVKANNTTDSHLGTKTSNDFFRQMIVARIAQSETMFYAKIKGIQKPDNVTTAGQALKKGECGFTYLSGLNTSGYTSRPIVVTPLIPGTDRFDPKPFQGKAVILKMDNSVSFLPIRKDGHVWINGMNFLDPSHPLWGGKPPVIIWPE